MEGGGGVSLFDACVPSHTCTNSPSQRPPRPPRRRARQARRSSTKHLEMTAAKIAGPALLKLLVAIAMAVMAYLVSSSAPIMWELDGPALANQLQRSDLKCARPTEATHIRRLRRDTAPLQHTAARTRTALPPTAASTRGACRHHTAEAPLFLACRPACGKAYPPQLHCVAVGLPAFMQRRSTSIVSLAVVLKVVRRTQS